MKPTLENLPAELTNGAMVIKAWAPWCGSLHDGNEVTHRTPVVLVASRVTAGAVLAAAGLVFNAAALVVVGASLIVWPIVGLARRRAS